MAGTEPHPIRLLQLDQLYQAEFENLVGYAMRLLADHDRSRAEDIVQEAFTRFMSAPPEDPRVSAGWLRVVVQRLCYDHFRRAGQERRKLEGITPRTSPAHLSAEELVMQRVEEDRIRLALCTLDPRESRALWLRHNGYRYREIAQALAIEPDQVGMILLRAMKKLKATYQQQEDWSHG
jgi:RNA polymerase sigma-70 factor (ECF subfamily)